MFKNRSNGKGILENINLSSYFNNMFKAAMAYIYYRQRINSLSDI